jgi:hypothetical protein
MSHIHQIRSIRITRVIYAQTNKKRRRRRRRIIIVRAEEQKRKGNDKIETKEEKEITQNIKKPNTKHGLWSSLRTEKKKTHLLIITHLFEFHLRHS